MGFFTKKISVWPASPIPRRRHFFGSLVLLINPVEEAVADVVADADHRRHGAQQMPTLCNRSAAFHVAGIIVKIECNLQIGTLFLM